MGWPVHTRAWRAGIVACSLAWFGPVGGLRAEMAMPSTPAAASRESAEPFGLATVPLADGGLHDKWLSVQSRLEDEMVQLALCEGDRDGCVSDAALMFLDLVDIGRMREGRARLGEINRAVNLAIHPRSDTAQHGKPDVWMSPLATLARGGGDCEDYAIAKFVALQRAGVASDDLRIVILRDTIRGEHHAVTAARLDGRWLMLDNRRMAMVTDSDVRNLQPRFAIGPQGVMRYIGDALFAYASNSRQRDSLVTNSLGSPADLAFEVLD